MADRLVTVATFGSPFEAALARNRLQEAGIPACLTEEETVGLLGGLMGPGLSGIKLLVSEEHLSRAEEVLAQLQVEVESELDSTDEFARAEFSIMEKRPAPAESEDTEAITAQPSPTEPAETSIMAHAPAPAEVASGSMTVPTGDQLARRAFWAAVIGFAAIPSLFVPAVIARVPHVAGQAEFAVGPTSFIRFFPPLVGLIIGFFMFFYSLKLVGRLGEEEQLSSKAKHHGWIAVALDVLGLLIAGFGLLGMLLQSS